MLTATGNWLMCVWAHSMLTAMLAVKNLRGEHHDVWSVNVERAYHEEVRLPSGAVD